jgi:hypothetical protein
MKILKITFLIIAVSFGSCNKSNPKIENNCVSCEGKKIIKVLTDEPAHVRIPCHDPVIFIFELSNQYDGISGILPCTEIPSKYRVEGESVLISGNITNCLEVVCGAPNIRILPYNVFELTIIKSNER